jgi:translation initiation factor 2B subunit (eIF-2B alpha/beta/delta family)
VYGEICELALEHIHANEVILTYGRSRTIEYFLKVCRKELEVMRGSQSLIIRSVAFTGGR